jgi:hypothetical protein
VALKVNIEVSFFSKSSSTELTFIRLDPHVLAHVDLKSALLRVAYTTNFTSEGLLLAVIQLVGFQMPFGYKGESTTREFTFKGSFISLNVQN